MRPHDLNNTYIVAPPPAMDLTSYLFSMFRRSKKGRREDTSAESTAHPDDLNISELYAGAYFQRDDVIDVPNIKKSREVNLRRTNKKYGRNNLDTSHMDETYGEDQCVDLLEFLLTDE